MADPVKLQSVETVFGIRAASRLMTEAMPSWIQDLGILVEAVEATRPPGRRGRLEAGRGATATFLEKTLA